MSGCKPWPFFFALAVGSQISKQIHRLRRNTVLLQSTQALKGPDLDLDNAFAEATGPATSPAIDIGTIPRSPPHAAEVSPSDEWEKVDYAAGVASDQLRGVPKSMPRTVKAATCEAACLTCMQVNDKSNFPNCTCFATCTRGGDGKDVCEGNNPSWSNENPTTPSQLWEGKCQDGRISCSDCVSKELTAENDRCLGDMICMHKLRQRISEPVEHPWFCSKSHLSGCESFTHKPKENGWTCHSSRHQCEGGIAEKSALDTAMAYEEDPNFAPPILTPCVWCETTGRQDISKPAALQVGVDDVNVNA